MKLVFLLALTVVASCYAREVPDKFPPGVTPDTPPFSYVTPPPPPPSNEETKFPPGVTPDTPPFSYGAIGFPATTRKRSFCGW
uniref:Uncharacterized protein n=1 Tax=Brassica campestris TaxID=3711 RepID=M4EKA0_BRACM